MRGRSQRLLASAVALGLLIPLAGQAQAAENPRAKPSWSMVPQAKDTNNDGVIDGDGGVPVSGALTREPATRYKGAGNRIAQPNERLIGGALSWYLSPKGYPVALDACSSTGDEFRWKITRDGRTIRTTKWRSLTPRACSQELVLPEAVYSMTLEVRTGSQTARKAMTARVRNILIVAMGDSYASGEGNPRNVDAWLSEGAPFRPYWDDSSCNRSVLGAPSQAALALEQESAKTSVSLVNVTCTGATVDNGILGAQRSQGQDSSQIEQAAALLKGQEADIVLLSIGGNDVGFTSILQTCALTNNCPLSRPAAGPLRSSPTVQQGVQAQTAELGTDFERIAACLGAESCTLKDGRSVAAIPLAKNARVMPTLYPDITRAADGQPCRYLTITPADFAWARDTVLVPEPVRPYPYTTTQGRTVDLAMGAGSLNQQIAATSRLPGWAPVVGTWSSSGTSPDGHGVCAGSSAWVFGLTTLSGFSNASFHPNPTGQKVMARAIAQAASAR